MGALLSRLWKEHSLKIISVCIICVATLDPRKILYHLISSTRNVILSGVGIVAAVAMALTVREAYIILQENKRQEELLAKQKIDDRKNANVFKNAREKLDRMIRRGGKKRLLSCSLFLNDVCNMPSSVSNQLGELVELFVRDFICNWWVNIGTDYTFVDDVRLTTLGAVVEISRRASTVNVPVFLATDALEALRHHIIWFKELSRRVASKHSARTVMGSVNTTFFEDRNRLIEAALRSEGRMHVACESKEAELEYLRHITNEILARILTNKDYECPMIRHLFREALAQTVFLPIFTNFSEPDYMNWIIEKIFDDTPTEEEEEKDMENETNVIGEKDHVDGNNINDDRNKYSNVKNDEKISLRYYAGVMSNKLAGKYLSSMPACTFLIRRDEINLNTYIISSVGYVNSKAREVEMKNKDHIIGEFGRARTVSAPEMVANVTAKLSVSHWYVRLHNSIFHLIGQDTMETNNNNNNDLLENVLYRGNTMTSILYHMKSRFVAGLHFVDGKAPTFEILPWSISRYLDVNSLPICKIIFKKNKDSVVVDNDRENVYVEIMSRADIVRRKSIKNESMQDVLNEEYATGGKLDESVVDENHIEEQKRRQTMQDFSFLGFAGDKEEIDFLINNASKTTTASSSSASTPSNSPKKNIRKSSTNVGNANNDNNDNNNVDNNTSNIDATFDDSYLDRKASYLRDVTKHLNDDSVYDDPNNIQKINEKKRKEFRQRLLNELELALSKAQNDYCSGDLKNDMLEKHHKSVRNLVYAIENILLFGLKKKEQNDGSSKLSYWSYLSSISKISSDADLVVEMIGQMSNIEILTKDTFWEEKKTSDQEKEGTITSTLMEANAEYIQNLGKSRAFLIVGLNKSLLTTDLTYLMKDKPATDRYYEPYSIVSSAKDKKYFMAQLDILMTMEFNINMNDVWDVNSDDLINQEKAKVLARTKRNSQEHRKKLQEEIEKNNNTRSVLRKLSAGSSSKVKDIGRKLMKLNLFGNKPIPKKRASSTGDKSNNNNDTNEKDDDSNDKGFEEEIQKLKGKGSGKQRKQRINSNNSSNTKRKKKKNIRQNSLWIGPDGPEVDGNNVPIESPINSDGKRRNRTSMLTSNGRESINGLGQIKLEEIDGPFSIILRAEVTHASLVDSEKKTSFFQNNQPHVEYHIRVQSTVTIGDYESVDTWEITQRYRVFFQLHRTLKSTYKLRISLPPKQLALFSAEKFDRRFLETRRVALNTYLNEILAHPAASHSNYVLAFLDVPNNVSEWKSVWKRMKERDTESFIFNSSPRKKRSARSGGDNNNGINNNINNNNNISTINEIDVGRSKSHYVSSTFNTNNNYINNGNNNNERSISLNATGDKHYTNSNNNNNNNNNKKHVGKKLASNNNLSNKKNEKGKKLLNNKINISNKSSSRNNVKNKKKKSKKPTRLTTTIEMASVEHHIFNLAREIFEIDDLSLMRRKFVNIMHGFMNITSKGSAYNYLNNVLGHMVETEKIADTVKLLKDYLWPNGEWDDEPVPEDTPEVMLARREKSLEHLRNNVPESLENLFTKNKCQDGINTLHDFLQCKILVKNFLYTFVDLLLLKLFDDISVVGLHQVRKKRKGNMEVLL